MSNPPYNICHGGILTTALQAAMLQLDRRRIASLRKLGWNGDSSGTRRGYLRSPRMVQLGFVYIIFSIALLSYATDISLL
jgi:hypothetical protein